MWRWRSWRAEGLSFFVVFHRSTKVYVEKKFSWPAFLCVSTCIHSNKDLSELWYGASYDAISSAHLCLVCSTFRKLLTRGFFWNGLTRASEDSGSSVQTYLWNPVNSLLWQMCRMNLICLSSNFLLLWSDAAQHKYQIKKTSCGMGRTHKFDFWQEFSASLQTIYYHWNLLKVSFE